MSHDEIELSHTNDCDRAPPFNVAEFYERKRKWALETFGPKQTADGVIAHLRSELKELRAAIEKPDRQIGDVTDICEELADVCLLAIDLSWRAGGSAADFRGVDNATFITYLDALDYIGRHLDSTMPPAAMAAVIWDIAFRALGCDGSAILEKFEALQTRTWPDWRTVPADRPIEHVREPATIQIDAAAHDPSAVAAEVAGQFAAWSETATAMVIVERLHGGAAKTMRVVDLIAQWRKLGDEVTQSKVALLALQEQFSQERTVALLGQSKALYPKTLAALGAAEGEAVIDAARRVAAERDALRSDAALAEERVSKERAEWRADSERLRLERDDVRKVLAAQPNETVPMAAQRAIEERDLQNKRGDDFLDMLRNIRAALGVGEGWTAAALVERAGQLRDDSVAYRSLRGRLVEVIDAPADFGDTDLLDLFKDRGNEPFSDSEVALEEQIERLERDLRTTLDALHVATGRRP